MQVWLPRPNVPENGRFFRQDQRASLFERALDRMEALPGVEGAAIVSQLPLRATASAPFSLEGMDVRGGQDPPVAEIRVISSEYSRVMGIGLREGRSFTPADDGEVAPVVVIDEALAEAYSSDADPWPRRPGGSA